MCTDTCKTICKTQFKIFFVQYFDLPKTHFLKNKFLAIQVNFMRWILMFTVALFFELPIQYILDLGMVNLLSQCIWEP